ncbi:MAG: peptide deformylase [Pseudomonadota bacterium]
MTKLTILEYPDPRLRTRAADIEQVDDGIRTLADDMLTRMYEAPGIGLAATQVDHHIRMLVADVSEQRDEPHVLINPVLRETDGEVTTEEGCLSIPDIYTKVTRAESITVDYIDRDGEPRSLSTDGMLAVCIQHEIDHLDGKLIVDYVSELKRRMIRKRLAKNRRTRA